MNKIINFCITFLIIIILLFLLASFSVGLYIDSVEPFEFDIIFEATYLKTEIDENNFTKIYYKNGYVKNIDMFLKYMKSLRYLGYDLKYHPRYQLNEFKFCEFGGNRNITIELLSKNKYQYRFLISGIRKGDNYKSNVPKCLNYHKDPYFYK